MDTRVLQKLNVLLTKRQELDEQIAQLIGEIQSDLRPTLTRGRKPSGEAVVLQPSAEETPGASPVQATKAKRSVKVYTPEFKRKVVAQIRKGMSIGEASRKYSPLAFASIQAWLKSGQFESIAPVPPKKATTKTVASKKAASKKTTARKVAPEPAEGSAE